ncbi:MAG: membrane protein insertion efficiency factor YidD [Desulfobacterales bacterium]|nr:membrane protein insertion efficiency factor YidD [Desulfobacterales bacterium]MBF0395878.1 membrane protein insertion efficiency factor YidD [Desulfobacterales bacterium]
MIILLVFLNTFAFAEENPTPYPIKFYQKFISKIDGNRCPMYPSCSQYAKEAINKNGFFIGWIIACDRLLRCGRDEVNLSPSIWEVKDKKWYCYDPVKNNKILTK